MCYSLVRQDEIARRNKILVEKICNLYATHKPLHKQEEIKVVGLHASIRKQNEIRISQENLDFSRRLIERKPCLDRKKWDTDYNLSKYYMSNICEYPSVDFGKKSTNYENDSIITNSSANIRSSSNGFNVTSQMSMGISGFTKYNKTSKEKFMIFKIIDGNFNLNNIYY